MNVVILLIFFMIGFTTSCASFNQKNDTELDKRVSEFMADTGVSHKDVSRATLQFETLDYIEGEKSYQILGLCNYATGQIKIHPEHYYSSPELSAKAVVYHELTHCVCLRSHDNSKFKDGCPQSIMNESIPSNGCLNKHWVEYIKDLKRKCE